MTKGKEFISQLKLYSDYLKWDDEKNRYETWEEACDKILGTHLVKYGDKVKPYVNEMKQSLYNKEFLASQRNLQFRGESIFKHNAKIYNCCSTYAYSPDVFNKGFYVLLSGTGLGVSLKNKYVSQLPKINKRGSEVKLFVIEDSIEGWAESVKVLISSYCKHESLYSEYFGYRIKFDYSEIRPKGAYISGGFKAPGYEGLESSIDKIEHLLNSKIGNEESIEFKSIIVYDILMHISDAVLSGGVRRSAMNVIIDEDDTDMMYAKTGNWRESEPQRARSNNSVGLIKNNFSKEKLDEYIALNNGDNDLGFVFMNHEDEMFNPCFTINQKILTDNGWLTFGELLEKQNNNEEINIIQDNRVSGRVVNGEEVWDFDYNKSGVTTNKATKISKTGENKEIYKIETICGREVEATDNHHFATKRGMIQLKDLTLGDEILIQPNNIYTSDKNSYDYKLGFLFGLYYGDGTKSDGNTHIDVWINDDSELEVLNKITKYTEDVISYNDFEIKGNTKKCPVFMVSKKTKKYTKYRLSSKLLTDIFEKEGFINKGDLNELHSKSKNFKSGFVGGFIYTDGSIDYNKKSKSISIRITQSNKKALQNTQLILQELGVLSKIYILSKKRMVRFHENQKEYECKESYRLVIPGQHNSKKSLNFIELLGYKSESFKKHTENNETKKEISYYGKVKKIEFVGKQDVYCLEENNNRTLIVEGLTARRCFEIGFNFYNKIKNYNETALQFCVAGDTKLITKDGINTIKETVGNEIEIWNGLEWSKVKPYKTGDSDRLHRVYFDDGSYLDATDNHKFLVKNRFQKQFKEIETIELIELLKNSKYQLQIPRSNISYNDGIDCEEAYNYGFILGDGYIAKNSKKVYASLYDENKRKIQFDNTKVIGNYFNYNNTPYTTISFENVDLDFSKELKYNIGLPSKIFTWNRKSIIDFISGWADSDGSNQGRGIRIYGEETKIRDGQLLLSKIGINSSVNLMGKKNTKTNLCVRKNDVWYLQIVLTNELQTKRLKSNNLISPKSKGKNQIVKKIITLDGVHESFCLTEEKLHQCVFNNVLTKQCNLCEINASSCVDNKGNFSENKFYDLCRKAAIIGTLQAGYTDFPYLGKQTEDIVSGEALLGVSITGWMTMPELFNSEILKKGANIVKQTNREVADVININYSARTTTTKPSGNSSVILKTSSGIHPEHSKRYFRIMQLNKESETSKWLEVNAPSIIEESKWSGSKTDYVVYSPCENNNKVIVKSEMHGIKHLELIKLVQNSWVSEGKQVEYCYNPMTTHNVSNTVIIDDLNEISDYLFDNQDSFAAVSFLSSYGDKDYVQAPFTSVLNTEELIKAYGDGAMFMAGLIVDGLHYFDDDLWAAVSYVMDDKKKLSGDRDQSLLRKDWIRRVKKFSKNYFKGDIQKTMYCMKDVHLWHKWNVVNREFKLVNFGEILTKPKFEDISKYGAISCSGGSCEIV